jgi:hypothetical protein
MIHIDYLQFVCVLSLSDERIAEKTFSLDYTMGVLQDGG